MLYKQGQLLILEQGEYSDFGYDGPFRVLKDFDGSATVEAFKKAEGYDLGPTAFIAWLARTGYIEDIDDAECAAWDLGTNYSNGLWPMDYSPTAEATAAADLWWKRKARHEAAMESLKADRERGAKAAITFSGPGYLDPV